MYDLKYYQETFHMLLEQRNKVCSMDFSKQQKYLPKLDTWINEIQDLIEHEMLNLKDSA